VVDYLSTDSRPRKCQSTPTKHDGRAVLFAVAEFYCYALQQCKRVFRWAKCLSVCLTNAWIVIKRKKLLPKFLYCMKGPYLVFRHEERLVGTTPCNWNLGRALGPNWPPSSKNAEFQSIFARSASAVTPSEKSSNNANRKSTARFSMSLRWTSYVALRTLSKSGLKNAKGHFSSKIALPWK